MDGTPYDPSAFPPVFVTVDIVVFTLVDARIPEGPEGATRKQLNLALIRRGEPPFAGAWALPGGFIRQEEDLVDAALRELDEEVGILLDDERLHQFQTYGAPDRDPRSRVVSVAFVALVHDVPELVAGSDARHAQLVPYRDIADGRVELAFDHRMIVDDALEHVRRLIEETDAALDFCPEWFTINDLRDVYQAVWRFPIERTGFHKKVMAIPGFIEPEERRPSDMSLMYSPPPMSSETGVEKMMLDVFESPALASYAEMTPKPRGKGRPPRYFRRGDALKLDPPLRRPKPRASRQGHS